MCINNFKMINVFRNPNNFEIDNVFNNTKQLKGK